MLLVALVLERLLQAYHGNCLGIDSETSFKAMSFFGEEGASVMDSQFECDWDRLMNHSYVWDLLLIRLSLSERKKTDTD